MFRYVSGDFPEDIVLDEHKIKWDVQFTNEIDLSKDLAKVDRLPDQEEGLASVVCYLQDGRHFMAEMDEETYEQLVGVKGKRAKKAMNQKQKVALCVAASVALSLFATSIAWYVDKKQEEQSQSCLTKWKQLR